MKDFERGNSCVGTIANYHKNVINVGFYMIYLPYTLLWIFYSIHNIEDNNYECKVPNFEAFIMTASKISVCQLTKLSKTL